jgi:hypothetical protein
MGSPRIKVGEIENANRWHPANVSFSFSVQQILTWADEWHERTGQWPKEYPLKIPGSLGEKWKNTSCALRAGFKRRCGR